MNKFCFEGDTLDQREELPPLPFGKPVRHPAIGKVLAASCGVLENKRNIGLVLLSGLLLSCAAPPQTVQTVQAVKNQASRGLSANVVDNDQCADLHQSGATISMSFAMCTNVCSGFDFFPQANTPNHDFAWLCGRLDFIDANVRLETLISPTSYQSLLANFEHHGFFDLSSKSIRLEFTGAESTSPSESVLHAPQFIIEAARDGRKHRVIMREAALIENSAEFQRFQAIWNAFNVLLPKPLQIELVHRQ